jgi:hypothetical protein
MRYRLSTLLVLTGVGPPAIAFLWFHWWPLLLVVACIVSLCLWVMVSFILARFFAHLVASVMD